MSRVLQFRSLKRLLPPHYFLLSCSLLLDMCHNHISPNFENDKNTHSKLEFQPKVGNRENDRLLVQLLSFQFGLVIYLLSFVSFFRDHQIFLYQLDLFVNHHTSWFHTTSADAEFAIFTQLENSLFKLNIFHYWIITHLYWNSIDISDIPKTLGLGRRHTLAIKHKFIYFFGKGGDD